MLRRSVLQHTLVLSLIAAGVAALVAITQLATADRIAANRTKAEQRVLRELLPPALQDAHLVSIRLPEPATLGLRSTRDGWLARIGATAVVILPTVARDGYSGDIELLVAIGDDGRISGVEVMAHRETPGLGDLIERRRSNWLDAFAGRSLDDPAPAQWTVKKEGGAFDQFTGATITPRAATHAIRGALDYFAAQRATLLAAADQEAIDE